MTHYKILETPLGQLRLVSNGRALVRIEFPHQHGSDGEASNDEVLQQCERQLQEYFAGERQAFQLPLAAQGTEFQQRVWTALQAIPFGERRSYRDIADGIGNRKAVRAVGAANGKNPIPIVVPCHRVIGSDGSLTGFAGGLAAKQLLLQLESRQIGMAME
ncbi:MAG: methylated-DNA--[protein]-cysteine S-methyltransferase [Gammaproteobacteria bacterium]|nr:methylated-DNA--[protein]-cysteine S-methyltransferase [Gammaproteobacteria bacterium]